MRAINGDAALLIVDCETWHSSSQQFSYNQSSIAVAAMNNVKQLIVVCNKMDKTVPKFSEAIYEEVKRTFYNCLKNKKSFNITSVAFVPISGLEGDNILEPSDRMLWFKGWNIERKDGNANGKTLLEALKTIEL
uniref:Tr-type G domain-containing protein n=1 Tax=Meloidogyne enterolobii TaxID=390850 RepID=A0A6V7XAB6_MELEN|nr:unnamed protein product [Meloidogyne enterolobii]